VSGRMFNAFAPQGTAFPYIVFQDITGSTDVNFTHKHEEYLYQFSLFSAESSIYEIGKMFKDLDALYDECVLSIDGWTFVYMHKEVMRGATRDEDKIWYGTADFRIRVEKLK